MASNGITSTSDMTYDTEYLKGYEALASVADCLCACRSITCRHRRIVGTWWRRRCPTNCASRASNCGPTARPGSGPLPCPSPTSRTTCEDRRSDWSVGRSAMNYSPAELDAVIDQHARRGGRCPSTATVTSVRCRPRRLRARPYEAQPHGTDTLEGRAPRRCRKEQFKRLPSSVSRHRWVPSSSFFGATYSTGRSLPRDRLPVAAIGDAFAAGLEVSFTTMDR